MTDLRDLLDTVAGTPGIPTPDVVEADARRGRRALLRRRSARTGAIAALGGAALVVGIGVVPHLGGDGDPRTTVAPAAQSSGVALVPFDSGATPKPVSASLVPEGWTVSGSSGGTALVISRPGVTSSPDDFRGKLVAMLAGDSTPAPDARPVTVGGREGTISVEGSTTILLFPLPDGRTAEVQAPRSLHWDAATLAQFAEGLAISKDAPVSVG